MSRRPFSTHLRVSVFALVATGLLAGCDENGQFVAMQGFNPSNDEVATPAEPGAAVKTIERDVEAPEVFSVTEAGLWDGRPSLGGVWVAHPDVAEPERVIIRNTANDKFVVGALFRRERDIPGPRLQISSDASEALGMLAGAPSELNVTALRKETVPVEPEPEFTSEEVDLVAEAPDIQESTLDPITSAAAAIDAPAPEPTPASMPTIQPPDTPETVQTASVPAPVASKLDKPFIQIGIFSVEANANRTGTQMRNAGMIPTIKRFEREGKPFWRVVVGPAQSTGERAQLLAKIKDEGFTDAYAVSN